MTLIGRTRARGVETLTLDSPANRNALSAALVGELTDALTDCAKDAGVRAIVLTHTGNTFCAGADLRDPPPPDALVALLRQIVDRTSKETVRRLLPFLNFNSNPGPAS